MENVETTQYFEDSIALYQKLFRIKPEIIAHDLHPEYLATKYARELSVQADIRLVPVQHHHAHIVSGMVDNRLETPAIGVAFDGTGYGSDGNIWGGEFLIADYQRFSRMGHFEYLPLPGGTIAIKKPYRISIGYILSLLGESALARDLPFLKQVDNLEIDIIKKQIEKNINSPLTSSCGRLFDAVSALLGIRGEIEYDAQAAIELEMLAYEAADETDYYPFAIIQQNGLSVVKLQDLLATIIGDLRSNTDKAMIALKFHNTVARMVKETCQIILTKSGINQVVLSGGVFQNRLLLRKVVSLLESSGFTVFTHRQVPCNDGGISLGQAVIANFNSK
jgi:hydrogenase maturation protein HypF